jgi:hypothetical protein
MFITMLHKVNNATARAVPDSNLLLMVAYKTVYPIQPGEKKQCRFMLHTVLRLGIVSHWNDRGRAGYYPGNKFTNKEPEMLTSLLRMIDKEVTQKQRFSILTLYDNAKISDEKIIFKISDGTIEPNKLNLYSLMFGKFVLPKWMQ